MQKLQFFDAHLIETKEQYGSCLVMSVNSLKALKLIHDVAQRKGILDEQEAVTAFEIDGKINDLFALYKKQVENIEEDTQFNTDQCMKELYKVAPELKIPRKRRNAAKDLKKQMKEEDVTVVSPSAIE